MDDRAMMAATVRMLPPAARQAFDGELQATRELLNLGDAPKNVAALPLAAAARVQSSSVRLAEKGGVACRSGCSWCCRGIKVDITAPEAVAIALFLDEYGEPDEREAERQEIKAAASEMAALSSDERWAAQTPCVFLYEETGECSIYPVRPLACRAHHSVDVVQCERAAADRTGATGVDKLMPLMQLHSLSPMALAAAYDEAGLDARSFELTNAVAVAMCEPDAAKRWRAGERLFDAAVISSDQADKNAALRDLANRGIFPPQSLVRKPLNAEDKNARKRARRAQRDARKKGRRK